MRNLFHSPEDWAFHKFGAFTGPCFYTFEGAEKNPAYMPDSDERPPSDAEYFEVYEDLTYTDADHDE